VTTTESQRQIRSLVSRANLLTALCLPLVLWQAWRLGRSVLRLDEAADTAGHVEGNKPAIRLLLLGESTASGVGAVSNDQALAGHLARALRQKTGAAVHWRVIGQNGFTAAQTRKLLCPRVPGGSADIVVLVHGFNDTVNMTSPTRWQKELKAIVEYLETRLHQPRIIFSGIPPFRHFPALPEPTRSILGLRADALELAADQLASEMRSLEHIKLTPLPGAGYFCVDGFHPSSKGYELWAQTLAEGIRPEA